MSLFRRDDRGQAVLEFALLLPPLILLLVFGMVEMGTAFSHNMSIASATREGARMGSNLANGGGTLVAPRASPRMRPPSIRGSSPRSKSS